MSKKPCVLVCVTEQMNCDRLIEAGRAVADIKNEDLKVLCVPKLAGGNCIISAEVEYLYQTAKKYGAEMRIVFHDKASLVAVQYAKEVNATRIVTGMPPDGQLSGFVVMVRTLAPSLTISMVSKEGTVYNMYSKKDSEIINA